MTQQAFATIEQVYNNPGDRVLRVVTGLACNVSDETIKANIEENARRITSGWLKQSEPHDGTAFLCGSGPSLADCLDEIRNAQRSGAKIFAMNGAASYLLDNAILADYQIVMDAKPETATLIGPARNHLFASQVDPSCFDVRPKAQLWHSTYGEWVPDFPGYGDDYCIIGGSVTVGNTAPALVYAMGYRSIRCFGYDSSHRNAEGHAFSQPMNDGDACVVTRFGDRDYVSSYAMKLQADTFMQRAKLLENAGCSISVEGSGLLPAMWAAYKSPMQEREKYALMWEHGEYRKFSPGEKAVPQFLSLEHSRGQILDIGCGTGRASVALAHAGFSPRLIDFADNARDEAAESFPFSVIDITTEPLPAAPFGFCCDVMEHLPPETVAPALRNILAACGKVFFQISTVPDSMGSLIGKQLHLTVKPFDWWRDQLRMAGAHVVYAENASETVVFYVNTANQEME